MTLTNSIIGITSFMAVVVAQPDASKDIWSLMGAGCAIAVVFEYIKRNQKGTGEMISAVASSLVFGITCPGLLVWWVNSPNWNSIGWQLWALLGFVFGLFGWSIVKAIMSIQDSLDIKSFLLRVFSNLMGIKENKDKE